VLPYLLDLVARLGHWSYLIIFVAATLESAAFAGLIVPGESLVLASGFFAHQGVLELDAVIAAAAVGATLGDNIGYQLGWRLGRPWLLLHGARFGLKQEHLARADAFFARQGGKAVLLGRFIGFARALVPFVAGASRVLLGYFLGASWQMAERWIGRTSTVVAGAIALAVLVSWIWRRRARVKAAWRC